MSEMPSSYPASLSIDYPDRKLNRLTTFFRIFMVIPIGIVLALILGGASGWENDPGMNYQLAAGGGLLVLPLILMILFRKKYPRWWFDWNINLYKFITRVDTYFLLLNDIYPSTDEEQYVHIDIRYPDAQSELKRGMPLVKWFLAIPHYIVLFFLSIAVVVVSIIAWFAILFTGIYPRSMFGFVEGVFRWSLRVTAYAFILTTDKYPPFSLAE